DGLDVQLDVVKDRLAQALLPWAEGGGGDASDLPSVEVELELELQVLDAHRAVAAPDRAVARQREVAPAVRRGGLRSAAVLALHRTRCARRACALGHSPPLPLCWVSRSVPRVSRALRARAGLVDRVEHHLQRRLRRLCFGGLPVAVEHVAYDPVVALGDDADEVEAAGPLGVAARACDAGLRHADARAEGTPGALRH